MAHSTFNVSFYCRPSRVDKDGLAPVELVIIINGDRATINLPRKERPGTFKTALTSRRNSDIKDYLSAVRKRLDEIVTDMMDQGIILNAETLKGYFQYGGVRNYTVQDLFDEYIAIVQKKDGTQLTHKTVRKYELARDRFYDVIDKRRPVTGITSTVIAEYMRVLRIDYNSVTTAGYAQKVKSVVKYGLSKGFIKVDPFIGIHIRKDAKDVDFLTTEEIEKIRDTDFKNESINRIRDLFIFQASSGLSYCDMFTLVPEDFQMNQDGHMYIHKRRAKTNIFFTSVILPDGEDIVEKYDFKLPVISNNSQVKLLSRLAGIPSQRGNHQR